MTNRGGRPSSSPRPPPSRRHLSISLSAALTQAASTRGVLRSSQPAFPSLPSSPQPSPAQPPPWRRTSTSQRTVPFPATDRPASSAWPSHRSAAIHVAGILLGSVPSAYRRRLQERQRRRPFLVLLQQQQPPPSLALRSERWGWMGPLGSLPGRHRLLEEEESEFAARRVCHRH